VYVIVTYFFPNKEWDQGNITLPHGMTHLWDGATLFSMSGKRDIPQVANMLARKGGDGI
jgi:hypothetical protein